MTLTDLYVMAFGIAGKSKSRFDCVASTGEYEPFEDIARRARVKHLFFYYNGVPDNFSANAQRKADKAITNGQNISSVFTPDIEQPLKGYGDTKGTRDGLLFLFREDYKQVEVFVARGRKGDIKCLFTAFCDGELDEEVEVLRNRAKPTGI